MAVDKVSEKELFWLVVIHVVFVISSVLLALSDWISHSTGRGGHGASGSTGGGSQNGASDTNTPDKPSGKDGGETMIAAADGGSKQA